MAGISADGVIAQEWIMVGVALVFVILRLWVRGWLQARLALSDLFVVLAWIFNVVSNFNDYLAWKFGLWNHALKFGGSAPPLHMLDYIPDESTAVKALKNLYTSSLPYYLIMYFVKGSFLLFYMKLFPKSFRKLRIALWISIVFTFMGLLASLLSNIFWCIPISRNWTLDESQQCLAATSEGPYFIACGFHVISDLLIYAMPFFLLRHLALSRKKVIGLALIFSLGGICIALTIARIVVVGDSTTLILLGSLGSAEITTAIIVACCPPLKWLYHSWLYRPGSGRNISTLWKRGRRRDRTTTENTTEGGRKAKNNMTRSRKSSGASRTSRTRTDTDLERERRGWTGWTFSAMDPNDGYDIMNDSEPEGATRSSRERNEIELEFGRVDSDEYVPGTGRIPDYQDGRIENRRPSASPTLGTGVVMIGQRIMDQQHLHGADMNSLDGRPSRSNESVARPRPADRQEDPDEIRHWTRQDSVTRGFDEEIRHAIRSANAR